MQRKARLTGLAALTTLTLLSPIVSPLSLLDAMPSGLRDQRAEPQARPILGFGKDAFPHSSEIAASKDKLTVTSQEAVTPPTLSKRPYWPDEAAVPANPGTSDGESFGPIPENNPFGRFIHLLAADPGFTSERLISYVRGYYHDSGFDVPPSDFGPFEENSTLTFSYPLGDLDADGTEDLAFNTYCVAPWGEGCLPVRGSEREIAPFLGPCAVFNRLFGVSGANGSILWQQGIEKIALTAEGGCFTEFVVDVLDIPTGGRGILVYSFWFCDATSCSVPYPAIHRLHLLDAWGNKLWGIEEKAKIAFGYDSEPITNFLCGSTGICTRAIVLHADNLLVNPILQVPPDRGVRILPNATQPALFLQGVGVDAVFAFVPGYRGSQLVPPILPNLPPGTSDLYPLLEDYQPNEWASRLNISDGKELWRVRTFQADELHERSVFPNVLQMAPLSSSRGVDTAIRQYWMYVPCCFDQTGDEIPDLLYTTIEWSSTPMANLRGPYMLASRIVLFDGATGAQVYQQVAETGAQRFWNDHCHPLVFPLCAGFPAFSISYELLGDANGDNASDILLHLIYATPGDYRHVLSVRDGKTGNELWRLASPRDLAVLVLGDASRDGGNDFLVMDWFSWRFPGLQTYTLANATWTRFTVFNGADGTPLWTGTTFAAPIDLVTMYENFKSSGLPDVNGDGVGDVIIDDLGVLPDLTAVHRQSYLNGRDGSTMFTFTNVGRFAFPAWVGDLTNDDLDDFAILNGDINDLWLTMYAGTTGDALWSRRLITTRLSDTILAIPRLRFHPMILNEKPDGKVLGNMHFFVTMTHIPSEDVFQRLRLVQASYPALAMYDRNGSMPWSLPRNYDNESKVIVGETPVLHALEEQASPPPSVASKAIGLARDALPTVGGFGAAGVVSFVAGNAVWSRRRRGV